MSMNEHADSLARLREGRLFAGTWLSLGSPVVAEVCAHYGFDWMLLDLEHGCGSEAGVLAVLQATSGRRGAVIVRVPGLDAPLIGRVLDWGAAGVMVPHVRTAGEAAACVAAMRFAPRGKRGYSSSSRVFHYGIKTGQSPDPVPPPALLTQIECAEGVRNARAIAAIDGVDCLFIGPTDLRQDLESRPGFSEDVFQQAIESVTAAARESGIAAGILLSDPGQLDETRERGITCVAVSSDLKILRGGYERLRAAIPHDQPET
jgi:2-keto-3-deoxy-L-rhamnonate aldolase RhmA